MLWKHWGEYWTSTQHYLLHQKQYKNNIKFHQVINLSKIGCQQIVCKWQDRVPLIYLGNQQKYNVFVLVLNLVIVLLHTRYIDDAFCWSVESMIRWHMSESLVTCIKFLYLSSENIMTVTNTNTESILLWLNNKAIKLQSDALNISNLSVVWSILNYYCTKVNITSFKFNQCQVIQVTVISISLV